MLTIQSSVIVISFSDVMMPGPMFAVTLVKSYKSPLAGTQMSLGHAVIEVPLILLIYFGFARFFQNNIVQLVLSVLGGGMIVWMGISMFRAKAEVVTRGKDLPYSAFVAGIIMTGLNPYFLLWWATIGLLLVMKFQGFGIPGLAIFTIIHWLCDLAWLTAVSFLIYRTQNLWSQKLQKWIFVGCAFLLIVFGVRFLITGIQMLI